MVCDFGQQSSTLESFLEAAKSWDLPEDFCNLLWQTINDLDYAKNPTLLQRYYSVPTSQPSRLNNSLYSEVESNLPDLAGDSLLPASLLNMNEDEDKEGAGETDVYLDIEVKVTEPRFLQGQTAASGAKLPGVNILKNPEGTLARSAAKSVLLAKERKEHRELERTRGSADERDGSGNTNQRYVDSRVNRPWEAANEKALSHHRRFVDIRALGLPKQPNKSIVQRRKELPIYSLKEELLQAVADNDILILIGETGSGKTTQLPQYLMEAGYGKGGIIGCTQPRRVAATSIAQRVSEEFGCRLGQEVGYTIRFEDITSADTIIKYMTDGILLRECIVDQLLDKYSILILDEAHERTIATDVLFGLLKKIQSLRNSENRKKLKLIVTSATLDAEKFSAYFHNAPIFTIPGRTFPVEIFYATKPETDYLEACLMTVLQIHLSEPSGDILVFLTGQEEIEAACAALHFRMQALEPENPPPLIILPVYASLPSEMQTMIFEPAPPGCRKCVIATNIAEASLTIDGIKFVVDSGVAKVKVYNAKTGIESLTVVPISQANARQRSGRAGRTGPGKCFRLYTEESYNNEMLPSAIPEIQRSELCSIILQLKALGVTNLLDFDFMDKPPVSNMVQALQILCDLKALDEDGYLTKLGRRMAEFPMEPQMAKTLLTALDLGVALEMVTISSMLQVDNIFYRPRDKFEQAEKKKARFASSDGDHITYLNIYNSWTNNSFSKPWCYENFLHYSGLKHAQEIRKQLITILSRYSQEFKEQVRGGSREWRRSSDGHGQPYGSTPSRGGSRNEHRNPYDHANEDHLLLPASCSKKTSERVRQAICAGYFRNIARRDQKEGYRTLIEDQQVYLHPMSTLHLTQSEYVLYHRLMLTTKEYIRDCCVINPKWLPLIAPHLYEKADARRLTTKKMREKIEPMLSKHEDPNSWRLSKRRN